MCKVFKEKPEAKDHRVQQAFKVLKVSVHKVLKDRLAVKDYRVQQVFKAHKVLAHKDLKAPLVVKELRDQQVFKVKVGLKVPVDPKVLQALKA